MRSHRSRDASVDAPPSSRRPQRASYRFATLAALVRHQRLSPAAAEQLVRAWARYVAYAERSGKDPVSTSSHLVRFERFQHARDADRNGSDRRVRRCGRGTEIQSLIFPSDSGARRAVAWAHAHGFRIEKVDMAPTTGSIRIQQRPPADFERGSFRTIFLDDSRTIRAVIACPRAGHEGRVTGAPRR